MAMDSQHYVAADGNGGWIVYWEGRLLGPFSSQQEAEGQYVNLDTARSGYAPTPTPTPTPGMSPGGGGGGDFPIVGGTGQLDSVYQAAQMEYLLKKLRELELPGLDLQRRAQILSELSSMSNLTGYIDPSLWQQLLGGTGGGGGTGAATGNYNTVNGQRTIDQMRQELVAASGGMDQWRNATDDQVISEYGKVTKQAVTPIYTDGGGGAGGGVGDRQNTIDRDRLDELKRQFDEQLKASQQQQYAQLLASLTGPTDWLTYQRVQAGLPQEYQGGLLDIFRNTPAFGAATPLPGWRDRLTKAGPSFGFGSAPTDGVPPYSGPEPNPGTGIPPYSGPEPNPGAGIPPWFGPEPAPGGQGGIPPYSGPEQPGGSVAKPSPGVTDDFRFPSNVDNIPPWFNLITDADRTYNDTYHAAQAAKTGRVTDDFRYAPRRQQSGSPVPYSGPEPNPGYGVPPYSGPEPAPGGGGTANGTDRIQDIYRYPQGQGPKLPWFDPKSDIGRRKAQQQPDVSSDRPAFIQPNQISPRAYSNMSPSQRGMTQGVWEDYDMPVADMWDKMRKAWSGSRANPVTRWR